MKRRGIWIALTCLIVASLVLVSCNKTGTNATITSSTTSSSTTSATTKTTTTTNTAPPTSVTSTTAVTGHWWDKLGTPQYGGEITVQIPADITSWDPYYAGNANYVTPGYMEYLFANNWTTDPATFNFTAMFSPIDYTQGLLAQSYEIPDTNTFIVHLRQGIHWQNIAPANGRELTADDIVYDFDRMWGLGDGFTKPNANNQTAVFAAMQSVTATDKYTVVFKFKGLGVNLEAMREGIVGNGIAQLQMPCPDAVKQYGDLNDWHHAVGTGPFILTDFVSGSSATFIKNPNYWGSDERYPQNKLPYVDGVNYLIIPDTVTALAALRSGKIDMMGGIGLTDASSLKKTNSNLLYVTYPPTGGFSLDPKVTAAPFNDIRVREAIQKAIDVPTIANTYYGGLITGNPQSLTSNLLQGWGFPYAEWPQSLKDEYSYDPTAAKKLLADAGYPNGFNTNIVVQPGVDLSLFQIVKSYLAAVNINMDIQTKDNASFTSFLANKANDTLVAKVNGPLDHDYAPLDHFTAYTTNSYGNYMGVSDPIIDAAAAKSQAATSSVADIKQALKDTNEQIAKQHYIISLVTQPNHAFYWPWFKGFSGQYTGIKTAGSAAAFWAFYDARFWIDQNLKKSMGH